MSTNKGSPLPPQYWVRNDNKDEFINICTKYRQYTPEGTYRWYKYTTEKDHDDCQMSKPTDDLPIYSLEEWRTALTTEQTPVYAVGDWVVVTKHVGSVNKIGDIKQITGTKQGMLESKYQTCYNLHPDGKDCSNWECATSIRKATPAEIAASTQVSTDDYRIEKIKDKMNIKIRCNSPEEYQKVLEIWEEASIKWGSGHNATEKNYYQEHKAVWYAGVKEHKSNYLTNDDKSATENIPASLFIAHNSKEKEYKVGDWVYIISGGSGAYGCDKCVGQITNKTPTAGCTNTRKTPTVELPVHSDNYYKIWQLSDDIENGYKLRPATQQEIDQATGKVKEGWKVGDKLENIWLRKQSAYTRNGSSSGSFSMASGDREVIKVYDGYAYVSGTGSMWLSPDQYQSYKNYMSSKSVSSEVPVTQANAYVGMKVVRGKDWSYSDQDGGAGEEGAITTLNSTNGPNWVMVKWNNHYENHYRIGANQGKHDLYIAPNNTPTEKKTMDDWKGTRVIVMNYNDCSGPGTVTYAAGSDIQKPGCFTVMLDNGKECSPYTPWARDPQCEIINESKQVNNQSITNQKPKTTNNGNSKQQEQQDSSTGTAVNLSANSSTVCRSDRRAATAVRCTGQPILTIRGHRGNPKGLRLS